MQTMYRTLTTNFPPSNLSLPLGLKSVQSRLAFLDALAQAGQNYRQLVKEVVIKSRMDQVREGSHFNYQYIHSGQLCLRSNRSIPLVTVS